MKILFSISMLCFGVAAAQAAPQGSDRPGARGEEGRLVNVSDWSEPVNLGPSINTEYSEDFIAVSDDELSLVFASDRPEGLLGHEDLWVAERPSRNDDWGPAKNLGPKLNPRDGSEGCPALSLDQHWLFFSSDGLGGFGASDVFASFRENTSDNFGWEAPVNLGKGVNSPFGDSGQTFFVDPETGVLTMYFASNRLGGGRDDWDIYVSILGDDGTFAPAVLVPELNSLRRDAHPTITRDGLEIFLASNREGSIGGSLDLWVSRRATTHDAWSTPVNLGPIVNTAADDRAPYLSADGERLYFTSNRRPGCCGGNDFYVTTRSLLR